MAAMTSTQAQWQLILLIAHARAKPSKLPGAVHHVIPRSVWKVLHKQGKTTVPQHCPVRQLVFLSHQQHLMAHFLLWQVHKGHKVFGPKMATAFCFMMGQSKAQGVAPTPAQQAAFAKARIAVSKALSKRFKGVPMSTATKAKMAASARKHWTSLTPAQQKARLARTPVQKATQARQTPVLHIPSGRVFASAALAAQAFGVSRQAVSRGCAKWQKGKTSKWQWAPQCKICGAGLPQGTPKGSICKVCMGV